MIYIYFLSFSHFSRKDETFDFVFSCFCLFIEKKTKTKTKILKNATAADRLLLLRRLNANNKCYLNN